MYQKFLAVFTAQPKLTSSGHGLQRAMIARVKNPGCVLFYTEFVLLHRMCSLILARDPNTLGRKAYRSRCHTRDDDSFCILRYPSHALMPCRSREASLCKSSKLLRNSSISEITFSPSSCSRALYRRYILLLYTEFVLLHRMCSLILARVGTLILLKSSR